MRAEFDAAGNVFVDVSGDPPFTSPQTRPVLLDAGSTYVTWPQFEALAEHVSGQNLTGFFQAWFRDSTVPADAYLWPGALKP